MLTPIMKRTLEFIASYMSDNGGVSPSYAEIGEGISFSKARAHNLVVALEKREYIRRLPHCARALEVLRMPGESSPKALEHAHIARLLYGKEFSIKQIMRICELVTEDRAEEAVE